LTKPYELETWTKFTFPGRGAKYSAMQWNWNHFSGVDYDARRKEHGVFQLVGDGKRSEWAKDVSEELGNYDYLSVHPSNGRRRRCRRRRRRRKRPRC
jgi:alpha-amylase